MWWRLCVCSLGILLLAPCSLSEKFSLAGSPHPVVGVVGRDVVLPCQLSPPARLPSMEVRWRKIGSGFIPVHEYSHDGPQDMPGESYQTRTELFLQEFSSGNVSLKLKRLLVVDAGKYQCFVRNPGWSREATTELQVAAVAPVFIDVLGPQDQGIGLACRSAGWFPKPELQWVGKNWQNLSMEIVTSMTQDRENLYSVVSHVTVTEGEENEEISCIVWNGLLETVQQSAIHLSDGEQIPTKPLQPDFEAGRCVREYMNLVQTDGKHMKDCSLLIDCEEFAQGYTLFAFDLSPDQECADHYALIKTRNLRAEIRFGKALMITDNMIVHGVLTAL